MKHYSHKAKPNLTIDMNVEFGKEFSDGNFDTQLHDDLLTARAGGMITRRLVEAGEEMLVNKGKSGSE